MDELIKMTKNGMSIKTSGVYFIKNLNNQLIKIGCSNNINKRIKDLQTNFTHLGKKDEIILIDAIFCDKYRELESYLHKKFKEKREIGEWFSINEKDIDIKNTIKISNYNLTKDEKEKSKKEDNEWLTKVKNIVTKDLNAIRCDSSLIFNKVYNELIKNILNMNKLLKNEYKIDKNKIILTLKNTCVNDFKEYTSFAELSKHKIGEYGEIIVYTDNLSEYKGDLYNLIAHELIHYIIDEIFIGRKCVCINSDFSILFYSFLRFFNNNGFSIIGNELLYETFKDNHKDLCSLIDGEENNIHVLIIILKKYLDLIDADIIIRNTNGCFDISDINKIINKTNYTIAMNSNKKTFVKTHKNKFYTLKEISLGLDVDFKNYTNFIDKILNENKSKSIDEVLNENKSK